LSSDIEWRGRLLDPHFGEYQTLRVKLEGVGGETDAQASVDLQGVTLVTSCSGCDGTA